MEHTITIDEARWGEVQGRGLDAGCHDSFAKGVCAMEAAARSAAESALNDTRLTLQASAAELVKRMCALTDADLAEAA